MKSAMSALICIVLWALMTSPASAQPNEKLSDEDWVKEKPTIGDTLADLTIYSPDGKEWKTSDLRGHYTVLTFGCLTWPPFLWNVSGLEAVYRDYESKNVKCFFIYKTLAHPELVGNYVQPFTLDERLAHARQAQKQLGSSIPWVVDAMDNRLKHALGNRPNSEFIVDPKGKIVRKRAWSFPAQVRKDLEQLVGKTDRHTKEEEIKLNISLPFPAPAERGVVPRIVRPRMQAIVLEPQIEKNGQPFYAKLRAEANPALLNSGKGKIYLGFHLDPFHNAHWNNLTDPLKYKMELPKGVTISQSSGESKKVLAVSDSDPREFLLDVESWPAGKPLKLTVSYSACVGEKACYQVTQHYRLHRKRDIDGGGARGEGAGFWDPETFANQLMTGDKDGDGKLKPEEVRGLVRPHFVEFDKNKDGLLDFDELKAVSSWLNKHHKPGIPDPPKK